MGSGLWAGFDFLAQSAAETNEIAEDSCLGREAGSWVSHRCAAGWQRAVWAAPKAQGNRLCDLMNSAFSAPKAVAGAAPAGPVHPGSTPASRISAATITASLLFRALNRLQFEKRRSAASGSGTGDRSGFGLRANETSSSELDAVEEKANAFRKGQASLASTPFRSTTKTAIQVQHPIQPFRNRIAVLQQGKPARATGPH
jgi:hypothetical protein